VRLHLIQPMGFTLAERNLHRAGLDYWPHVDHRIHRCWEHFLAEEKPGRMLFASTKGEKSYLDCRFAAGDYLVFGGESRGLPAEFYDRYREYLFRIPMPGPHSRSLNLANAASVVMYEAYRQLVVVHERAGEWKTLETDRHVATEERQWASILAEGDPVLGMPLIFIQKMCAVVHEFEPAFRVGALCEEALPHFRGRILARMRRLEASLRDNGLATLDGYDALLDLMRAAKSAGTLAALAGLAEQVHLLSHRLVDAMRRR
jgi:tRNA (cytidine/uridine-2'-O-)-methyltransferase